MLAISFASPESERLMAEHTDETLRVALTHLLLATEACVGDVHDMRLRMQRWWARPAPFNIVMQSNMVA